MSIRKKLIIVGDSGCGKTSLLNAMKNNTEPKQNSFDNINSIEVYSGTTLDTEGQEEHVQLRPVTYPDNDVVLICYSIDDPGSLENIRRKWLSVVKQYNPNAEIVLVGTKKDVRYDINHSEQRPILSVQIGQVMCQEISAYGFLECSSKTKEGVRDVFELAAQAALNSSQKHHHQHHHPHLPNFLTHHKNHKGKLLEINKCKTH